MTGRVFVSVGGPTRAIMDESGKKWHFEMHRYCGPMPTDKKGDELKSQPSPSFWRVVSWWAQQGQEIGEDGLCSWAKPEERKPRLVHMGGKHYKAVYD